ncbi:MAG TPA: hypothetical protein VGC74_04080 [Stenotrophomonas sp.]|jgi:hypothetical protein
MSWILQNETDVDGPAGFSRALQLQFCDIEVVELEHESCACHVSRRERAVFREKVIDGLPGNAPAFR